jgi:hypothetical protein
MKYKQTTMQARAVQKEALSPKQFLDMKPSVRKMISETTIAAPKLGGSSFGKLIVHYKSPIYKVG